MKRLLPSLPGLAVLAAGLLLSVPLYAGPGHDHDEPTAAAEAIEDAASKRLRPIVMTKMVCILGLVPLWLFGGAVWTSLAVVMMGGLALGTLITLGLIPALYAAAYRVQPTKA